MHGWFCPLHMRDAESGADGRRSAVENACRNEDILR
jgi:hypothetical protein